MYWSGKDQSKIMNFDMKKLSIDEVEIDIKNLIKRCIEHFKFIIIILIIKPIAKIRSTATMGVAPEVMGIGPAYVIPKALDYADLTMDEIGYFEIDSAKS